ncbi:MAG: hypothetical protein ACK5MQ_06555 [Pikeienuella sp.]
MSKPVKWLLLPAVIAVAGVGACLLTDGDGPFLNLEKVGQDARIPVAAILPEGVASLCVLGPYQEPALWRDRPDPALMRQLDPGPVPEDAVRVALFDRAGALIREAELPRTAGPNRVQLADGVGARCDEVGVMMVDIAVTGRSRTVRFSE